MSLREAAIVIVKPASTSIKDIKPKRKKVELLALLITINSTINTIQTKVEKV